jgi:hypothetical protein
LSIGDSLFLRILHPEAMLKGTVARLVIAALPILGWVLWKRSRRPQTYVIGQQLADARRAEQERLARGASGPSPLPAHLRYDAWQGDFDLSNPAPSPLDAELSALCQRFAASDDLARSRIRDSASMQDFYTLLSFSKRSAVFAVRDHRRERVIEGLTAVAMIDKSRIDFRDGLQALGLLQYAASAVGEPVEDSFRKASSLAEPQMRELILGFLTRPEDRRDLKSWGYAEVETKAGPGFIGWDFQPYRPTYPLDQVGLALADLLQRDKYGASRVALASKLWPTWLASVDDNVLKQTLASIRGVVTINATLRPQESPDYKSQTMVIFLAELPDEPAARSLFRLAQEKQTRSNNFAMLAVQESRLFCLVIAQSFVGGTASFETQASVQRFSAPIADVLKQFAK